MKSVPTSIFALPHSPPDISRLATIQAGNSFLLNRDCPSRHHPIVEGKPLALLCNPKKKKKKKGGSGSRVRTAGPRNGQTPATGELFLAPKKFLVLMTTKRGKGGLPPLPRRVAHGGMDLPLPPWPAEPKPHSNRQLPKLADSAP